MEERSGMWFGENTLKALSSFLAGYNICLKDQGSEESILPTNDFFEWIKEKLEYSESTAGWANMILASTIGLNPKKIKWEQYDKGVTEEQHQASIKKFYKLVEEYMNEKKTEPNN